MALPPRRPLSKPVGYKAPLTVRKNVAKAAVPAAPVPVALCSKCQANLDAKSPYCGECGAPVKQGLKPKRTRAEVKRSLEQSKNTRHVTEGRNTLMWVGILNLVIGVISYLSLTSQLSDHKEALRVVQMILFVAYFLPAVIFLGLYFWAKKNPLPATIAGLVVYVSFQIAGLAINPAIAANVWGWVFRIMIIGALAKGIKSAAYEKKMTELKLKKEAAARRAARAAALNDEAGDESDDDGQIAEPAL